MTIKTFAKKASNKIIRNTKWYNQYWNGAIKFWNGFQFGLDCVNLGSNSGLYGFDYSSCTNIKGANWALGPQSLVHDFNILKNYFSYIREGGVVFIPISPFSCLISKYTERSNMKYYTFLHPATICGFSEEQRIKALTIKDYPFKAMPLNSVRQTTKEAVKLMLPKKHNSINYVEDAKRMLTGWKKQFEIIDLDAPLSEQHALEQDQRARVLNDMVVFCKERDLTPVVVIPPVHEALKSQFSSLFRKHYIYDFVEKSNLGDTRFFDCLNDNSYTDEDFRSSFFLSEQGAKTFTKRVLSDLKFI